MDKQLLKLCEEVEDKTGWEDTPAAYLWVEAHHTYELDNGNPLAIGHPPIPAYTSDYLLEKLPVGITVGTHNENITRGRYYQASDMGLELISVSDTPLKALLKLTLELLEAGEIL